MNKIFHVLDISTSKKALHVLLCSEDGWRISHQFSFVFQSIGEELVSLEKGSIEGCQAFIKKHSQNLHPNHYYLMVSS